MTVRTVLGDIAGSDLGATDYHEHLFQVSPLLPGDELDDEAVSQEESRLLRAAGIGAIVEATPIGLGRNPAGLARISREIGLRVVATTGCHRSEHYGNGHWLLAATSEALAAHFITDIVEGMPLSDEAGAGDRALDQDRPILAGVVKAGIGYWRIDDFAHRVLDAIGAVHGATNAPVMVHLEYGSAAFEVLAELVSHGVAPSAVVMAHIDRNPDAGMHVELAQAGVYLGYDGPARHREYPDSTIIDCMTATAERGGRDRILLGGDVARSSRYAANGGIPGMAYLPSRFVPRLEEAGGAAIVQAVLVDNPRRYLDRFEGKEASHE